MAAWHDGGEAPLSAALALGVVDLVRDAVFVLDADDVVVHVNPVAAHDFGGQRELVGRRLLDVLPSASATRLPRDLADVREHRVAVTIDEYVPMLSGWYRIDLAPLEDLVVLQVREVTEGRRELRQRELVAGLDGAVAEARRLHHALAAAARVLRDGLEFDVAEVWMLDRYVRRPRLVFVEAATDDDRLASFVQASRSTELTPDAPPSRALHDGGLVLTPDLATDATFTRVAAAAAAGLRAGAHSGLDLGGGRSLCVGLLRRRPFDDDDAAVVLDRVRAHLATVLARHAARLDLEEFFEITQESIGVIGYDGGVRRVNPAFADLIGRPAEELVDRHVSEFIHVDDFDATFAVMADASRSRTPVDRIENRIVLPDGSLRWVSWSAEAFPDERVVYCSGRDVTAERRDRAARNGHNRILHAIVADAPLGSVLTDLCRLLEELHPDVRATVVLHDLGDGTLRSVAGPSMPPAYGAAVDGLRVGPGVGACGAAIHDRRETVTVDVATHPNWADLGHLIDLGGFATAWSVPILDADGAALGSLACHLSSTRRPTDDERAAVHDAVSIAGIAIRHRRSADDLSRSEERFRLLADVTTDAIWDWDLVTGTRWRSDGFRTLFGYVPTELGPDDSWWAEHLHPDDRESVLDDQERALRGDGDVWRSDYRFLRSDGSYAEVVVRAHIVRDASGRAVRVVGGMSDVTERRLLEQQYLRAQRVESLGTLAGGIAHDLNNSLAPITMAVELLQSGSLDPDVADTVDIIAASARRSADLVRKILTFARGIDGERTVLAVADLVHDAVAIVRDAFPKHIELVVDLQGSVASVRGDATQLHQVLVNLALNARDAMPDGGVLRISLATEQVSAGTEVDSTVDLRPGRYVRIDVTDTGIGIPPAVRDRLFEPFFTTKPRTEGTGLGLPTSLAIVRSHGGEVAVRSEPGAGSTFSVLLPTVAIGETAPPPAGDDPAAGPFDGGGATVLVVDDEPVVRSILREALAASGYQVLVASDGSDALERWDEHDGAIDLVLTDIMMAPMDGADLVVELRRRGVTVPIVAMTGLDETQRSAVLVGHGVTSMLRKPFDRSTMLRTLAVAR